LLADAKGTNAAKIKQLVTMWRLAWPRWSRSFDWEHKRCGIPVSYSQFAVRCSMFPIPVSWTIS